MNDPNERDERRDCSRCGGEGVVTVPRKAWDGEGQDASKECPLCEGSGFEEPCDHPRDAIVKHSGGAACEDCGEVFAEPERDY